MSAGHRDAVEKRTGDACTLQSFAKQKICSVSFARGAFGVRGVLASLFSLQRHRSMRTLRLRGQISPKGWCYDSYEGLRKKSVAKECADPQTPRAPKRGGEDRWAVPRGRLRAQEPPVNGARGKAVSRSSPDVT